MLDGEEGDFDAGLGGNHAGALLLIFGLTIPVLGHIQAPRIKSGCIAPLAIGQQLLVPLTERCIVFDNELSLLLLREAQGADDGHVGVLELEQD